MLTKTQVNHGELTCIQIVRHLTGEELAATSKVERLLGVNVHQDMKWNENIMNIDKFMMKQLQTRTNALEMVAKMVNFKTKKNYCGRNLEQQAMLLHLALWWHRRIPFKSCSEVAKPRCKTGMQKNVDTRHQRRFKSWAGYLGPRWSSTISFF